MDEKGTEKCKNECRMAFLASFGVSQVEKKMNIQNECLR